MRKIIAGDVHGEFEQVEKIIDQFKDDQIIWLGDYFDSFYKTPAEQLYAFNMIVERKNDIKLLGNHDLQYMHPYNMQNPFVCSGYSDKFHNDFNKAIHKNFEQFKYIHKESDYYITHAGITDWFYQQTMTYRGYADDLCEEINSFIGNYDKGRLVYIAGRTRGGSHPFGGIFWADWKELQFDAMDIKKQIVGHSQIACEQMGYAVYNDNDRDIWCIDSLQSPYPSVLILENNKVKVHKL